MTKVGSIWHDMTGASEYPSSQACRKQPDYCEVQKSERLPIHCLAALLVNGRLEPAIFRIRAFGSPSPPSQSANSLAAPPSSQAHSRGSQPAQPLRLPPVQDRFHNVGRQAGERQKPADVGGGDALLLRKVGDRRRRLPAERLLVKLRHALAVVVGHFEVNDGVHFAHGCSPCGLGEAFKATPLSDGHVLACCRRLMTSAWGLNRRGRQPRLRPWLLTPPRSDGQ
jgi:hypothetical protein